MIHAVGSYLVVSENEVKKQTQSGIILTEATSIGDTRTAKVVSIGPDVKIMKPGYDIVAHWGKAIRVSFDGIEYLLIKEEDVILVVE